MLSSEAVTGEMSVFQQAGVLGAGNWFFWPFNILLEGCDKGLASETLTEDLGRRVANLSTKD